MLADLGGLLRLVQKSLCRACKPPYLPFSSTTYHDSYCSQLSMCTSRPQWFSSSRVNLAGGNS